MTVKELIDALAIFPCDQLVVVDGHEIVVVREVGILQCADDPITGEYFTTCVPQVAVNISRYEAAGSILVV